MSFTEEEREWSIEIRALFLMIRKVSWLRRLGKKVRPHYCGSCLRLPYCGRLRANERFIIQIAKGNPCDDYKSFWEKL